MEAGYLLLMACQAQTLNLFVESYLKTVEALLESQDTNLHILASESFRQFSKKVSKSCLLYTSPSPRDS